jgi:hypothetical protein
MVVNISEVDRSSVGHITLNLLPLLLFLVVQGNGSVEVVPTQTINERLDWGERSLV